MLKHVHPLKVYFGDTDAAGIVFYPNYYRWMDQATGELIGEAITPVSKLYSERNIILPLLETFCQYKRPLFFEDLFEVHSQVTEVKDKVLRVAHEFKRDGEIVASGYELKAWTLKQGDNLKAVPVPDDVKEAFGLTPASK